jgi:hypothetical protein
MKLCIRNIKKDKGKLLPKYIQDHLLFNQKYIELNLIFYDIPRRIKEYLGPFYIHQQKD